MKRFVVFAGFLIACVASFPALPAAAIFHTITFDNQTDKCAWVTVYESLIVDPNWHPLPWGGGEVRAHTVHRWSVKDRHTYEIKVGAEVKSGPGCSGHNLEHTYDIRKKTPFTGEEHLTATLVNVGGKYRLWLK
jgi:hypothetical protein